jgi:hypothetical protein
VAVAVDYQIRSVGKICAGSGRPLVPGEVCVSVLVERDGVFSRLDYATDAWTGPPEGTVGVWRTETQKPVQVSTATVDPEQLLQFFEQLVETANPGHDRLRYVLALALLQRRRLKLEGAKDDEDGCFLELIGSRGEGPYLIRDQQLPQEEIRSLQAALNQQLSEQWSGAEDSTELSSQEGDEP